MNTLLFGLCLLGSIQALASAKDVEESSFVAPAGQTSGIHLPRDETLVYKARVDIAFIAVAAGEVVQTCRIEPLQPSVLLQTSADVPPEEVATLRIHAKGDYTLYSIDSSITARHMPREWPRTIYRSVRKGSKSKRRENIIGVRDGKSLSSYRRDTSKGAPRGTRIWRESAFREVPEGTIDMLSAVFLCRTLIRDDLDELSCPMVEKDRLWEIRIRRGEERRIETGAGTFEAVEALLEPRAWPDEEIDAEKRRRFEGLFGIQGTIHIWMEKNTGVPIRIQGDIPIGPLTLGIDVVLESYSGTVPEFRPIAK